MTYPESIIELIAPGQSLGIVPGAGGGLSHWRALRDGGSRDLLRPADPAALAAGDARGLSSFPLVPYSNRIREGRFPFAGRTIRLPLNFGDHPHSIHGLGWQRPWTVIARSANTVRLRHEHEGVADDEAGWPFAYRAEQRIALDAEGVTLLLETRNLSGRPMPVGLGQHPYFAHPEGAVLTARVDRVWQADREVMPTHATTLPAHWPLNAGARIRDLDCDNLFTGWRGPARIEWPDADIAVSLHATPPCGRLVVFTPPNEDFFCVEPVTQLTDAFNLAAHGRRDTGMRILAPGECARLEVRLQLEAG